MNRGCAYNVYLVCYCQLLLLSPNANVNTGNLRTTLYMATSQLTYMYIYTYIAYQALFVVFILSKEREANKKLRKLIEEARHIHLHIVRIWSHIDFIHMTTQYNFCEKEVRKKNYEWNKK